ncbi:tRNA 2-selenouridine(34) synthase MnmH [Sulfurospirillum barnesii]|uniref:tRNA 2-selenouridine synthase n=1 Tax=Sulfurospirillum barnesii (strain ATCC 700032 / DSM 10660 / SES-3) TaxID=760154 RepID=I3XXB4_SULBS|nr:tRNA 2-selenouridine(34) synthase MnmH [Sulfurospirillum barnesii]AFL68588.1 tRNA 2-selenouridine synthase [Sulfurospirillum barnesii SES-3]
MLNELDIDAFMEKKSSFELLIDVRSPKEFEASHMVGAANYYVLNDAEHCEVGTLYKNVSRNDAKLLGAHYICQNSAQHLLEIAKTCKIGSKIGIYCAKGGLRSSSLASILAHIGYQVYRLKGGYKSYRFYVLSYLENLPHHRFIVLGGNTGCGKSELLTKLSPSLDLEKMANHLGSSFGHIKGIQPNQKTFENNLCEILHKIDPHTYIFVEAESKKMGTCTIPSRLYKHIHQGIRVEITAPLPQRIERILKDYASMSADFFYSSMQKIAPYIQKSVKEEIFRAYENKQLEKVVELLLLKYYDVVYKKPQHSNFFLEYAKEQTTYDALNALHVNLSSTNL